VTLVPPTVALRVAFIVATLSILALALGACTGVQPASPPRTASPSPIAAATPSSSPVTEPRATVAAVAAEPQTIHLIELPTNVGAVRVGSLTGCTNVTSCQGDYLVGYDPLEDAVTGEEVGTLAFECFIVDTGDTLYHCPGITVTLTGRGQIVFTEFYWDGVTRPETSPISGGTGEFLGATGTVTSQRGGDFVIEITR
jgi:hypothetical protein